LFTNCFSENRAVYEVTWKIWYSWTSHRWQYNTAYALSVLDN